MKKEKCEERNENLQMLIAQIESENIKHYIRTRVIPQMQYYSSTSKKYKRQYKYCRILSIVFSVIISVLTVLSDDSALVKAIVALCGAAITAISAFLTTENSKDLWYNFRRSREALLYILYCYFYSSGIFANLNSQEKKDALLIERCEKEMRKENDDWAIVIDA